MRKTCMLVTALLALSWGFAGGDAVRATGYGTILGGDVAGARDEAIVDARSRAIEQAAGVFVDAETILENELILQATVRSTTSGFISDYRVVSEGEKPDGLYEVTLEAEVVEGEFQEQMGREVASNLAVVVMMPEENMGEEVPDPVVENAVVSKLVEAGFTVYEQEQLERIRDREAKLAALDGDTDASRRIGLRFLSNLIIGGRSSARFSQDTGGIVSARASASVRMVEVETGRIIANKRVDRLKGFDLSREEAGFKALEAAAGSMAETVVGWMSSEYLASRMQEVRVEIRGLENMNGYQLVGNLLRSMRWVEDVREEGYGPSAATYVLRYPEKLVYLASRLDRSPHVKLVEYGQGQIVLKAGE